MQTMSHCKSFPVSISLILIFIAGREKYAGQVRRVPMFRPVASSRMNNLSLEQLDVWSRKIKYCEYVLDEKDISPFGFMDASCGYGRIGMDDDTKISSQKRQSSFQSPCKFRPMYWMT
jgi:hypothetical protein